MSTFIEHSVQARLVTLGPRAASVHATLRYDADDPFAVHMTFPASVTLEGSEVRWTFARELLAGGLREPQGLGDVRVRPDQQERTVLEFHAPEGIALVLVRTDELHRFLAASLALVPMGEEHRHTDLDRDLARLTGDIC